MATINYADKVAINVNPNIPEINKVTDGNMNLIKQVGNQILTTMGVYTDNWSSSATYNVDEIAIYDNRIFKNLTGTNTATTPDEDTTNWEETTLASMSGGGGGGVTGDTLPIGSIVPYGSATAPTNWLVCDGSAVSRTTYAELFSAIGTTFGAGDGSTTFNLPNLKGRVPVGQDTVQTEFDTMGETGGSKELQSHSHTAGLYDTYAINNTTTTAGGTANSLTIDTGSSTPSSRIKTNNTGTGNSGNLQPYQVVCYIIKAKQSAGLVANVSNTYSTSETDTYSCDFINGEELFDGTETGEVTLSKSTTNYRYIEVIYTGADGDYGSTGKIPVVQNNKIAIMTHSFRDNEATLCMWLSTLLINGNKLTPQTSKWAYTNTNGTIGFGAGNYVNVKKVIGYK